MADGIMEKITDRDFLLRLVNHLVLITIVVMLAFPVYYAFVVSTLEFQEVFRLPPRLLPGAELLENYAQAWQRANLGRLLFNSTVFSLLVALGKIGISVLTAFALVYFDFRGKSLVFFLTLVTLMMPVPIRVVSTYEVISSFGWLNSFRGLVIPMMYSATGTFLFRQTFRQIPRELVEATIVDGGGPLRFLWSVLIPLSKTNLAALFVILFIWSWNRYLWPLVITTEPGMHVIQLGIEAVIPAGGDALPRWNHIMPVVIWAMLPPMAVILGLQKQFVKGLIEPEK